MQADRLVSVFVRDSAPTTVTALRDAPQLRRARSRALPAAAIARPSTTSSGIEEELGTKAQYAGAVYWREGGFRNG